MATNDPTTLNDRPSPVSKPAPRQKKFSRTRRRRYNASMKVVRRIHMYFGLVLTPFVLLYGITAFLFNHPSILSPRTTDRLDPSVFASIEIPQPDALADAIVTELAASTDLGIARVESRPASLKGDLLIDTTSEDSRTRYRLNPSTLSGTVQTTPITPPAETPFPRSVTPPLREAFDAFAEIAKQPEGVESARVRVAPDVEFRVVVDGEQWMLSCDGQTGNITAWRADEPRRPIDWRSFLLRLHVSHGYPNDMTARWIWAIIVDVMAGLMVFWALSGVIMWWQLKPTRTIGVVTFVGGLAVAAGLGYAMLRLMYY